ncbi:P-loop containing nucleoside triphosphate hydrolase protein [Myriangium duriaei CBS 260.36]|uniref:RNA helicase n=1 Tax=Myriangium duriaei CBS 260.36 TaxID=1168546 RepID=A0A9P4J4S1_9PEZI|nr:P-loop containing nucleoside triphosphate hydrolase protein [Myriangium duriaei CBS 260.36]
MARGPHSRHSDYRDRRDDRRDYYRGDYRDRRDDRDSRRDPRRLTPPPRDQDLFSKRGSATRDGRLERPDYDSPPRRDRSRDRKRERSPERDRAGRDHSRERLRHDRSYRDDDLRDHKRPRHDDYHRDRRGSGDSGRDRRHDVRYSRAEEERREKQAAEETEKRKKEEAERKLADRQARLAIWRAKKQAEINGNSSPRPGSARSSVAPSSPGTPQVNVATADTPDVDEPAKPFAGKFDHKEIAKRAKAKLENGSGLGQAGVGKALAEQFKKPDLPRQIGGSLKSTKGASKAISASFGMSKSMSADADAEKAEGMLELDDDDSKNRRRAMIPMADLSEGSDQEGVEQNEEGMSSDDEFLDEQAAANAARAAAEERAAAAAAATVPIDTVMSDAPNNAVVGDDEEIDPLDAYMFGLEGQAGPKKKRNNKLTEVGVTFSDDEDNIMDAVGDDIDLPAIKIKKKKEIPTVDHSKVEYEPFRKDFYTEPLELQEMSEEDVKSLRFELDDIKIQGSDVPKPVQKFAQFGLGSQVLDIINNLGFEKPTCIQAQAIPAIMSGRDVIGVAKTGSGKTAAFILPMFRHIKDQRPLENMEGPIGLIMAPTRELATQIHRECRPYLKALNLRAVCAYGGAPITEQIAALKRGAEIVVCTPGRLIDLLGANSGRVINLKRTTYVVMDEADRMFDMGFEPQISKVLNNIRPDRQCVLFSATFPRKMESLARKELHQPVQITVGGRSVVPKEITQKVEIIEEKDKLKRLLHLVGEETAADDDHRVLVFVERQDMADWLLKRFWDANYPCVSVHGGKEQIDRDDSLDDFKQGIVPVMFATSVAARGLDVKQLTLVVNYDVPSHLEDYVHRAGRTGRAGNLGTAVTFITPEQGRFSLDIVKALKQSETPVPEDLQNMADKFWNKVKEGSEKRWGASGFGGHGLEKLEQELNAEHARQRRQFKTDDQPDDEEEEKKKPTAKDSQAEAAIAKALGETSQVALKTGEKAAEKSGEDAQISELFSGTVQKKEKSEKAAMDLPRGGSKLSRAAAAAALINSRLSGSQGSARAGVSIDNRGPDAGEYYYKIEINDLPQKARWAVTNRGNVSKILDRSNVSITTKGQYYAPGVEPGPGDLPKMSILVEGDTELLVNNAVAELRRLLKEAIMMTQVAESRAPVGGGKYTVV